MPLRRKCRLSHLTRQIARNEEIATDELRLSDILLLFEASEQLVFPLVWQTRLCEASRFLDTNFSRIDV